MTDQATLPIHPIGVIHTPLTDESKAPIQSARSDIEGVIEVFPQYEAGLDGIEGFSHIHLIYNFFQAGDETSLTVTPLLDNRQRGVFATRFPLRPNPIGLSVVHLLRRDKALLYFKGADMLDGTLLLDIKPYLPEFDVFQAERIGWFYTRSKP